MIKLTLSDQTVYFLCSIALGLVLGAVYDLVRAVRILVRAGSVHVLISDVLFFILCGIITSLFALPFNKGGVRAFIVFGEAAGFLVFRLLPGSIMGKFYCSLACNLRKIIQKARKFIEVFFDFLLKINCVLVYNISDLVERFFRKASALKEKHSKDRLKKRSKRKDRSNEQKKRKKRKARAQREKRRR